MADDVTNNEEPSSQDAQPARDKRPNPLAPLLIGGIAYGLLFTMVIIIFVLIAWRLSGG